MAEDAGGALALRAVQRRCNVAGVSHFMVKAELGRPHLGAMHHARGDRLGSVVNKQA